MKYTTTITRISVHSEEHSPVLGETALHIEIDDEGAGPFLVIRSCSEGDDTAGKVSVDFEEWGLVDQAARQLMGQAALAQGEV